MKLMKIFGMVFALHVVLACVLVLIQGCRSTPARAPEAAPAAAAAEPVSENWSNQSSSSLAPTPVEASVPPAPAYGTGAPLSGLTPAERARQSPTRPENPESFVSTESTFAPAAAPAAPVTYVVRSGDSLWKIARAHGTTTAEIQKLNPSVKADSLRPGMTVKVPGSGAAGSPGGATVSPAASRPAGTTYIVKGGDSLSKIAARNGTTVAALREANNLRSDVIQLGQSLLIPGVSAPADGVSAPFSSPAAAPFAADSPDKVTIVVQRGDTLGEIARKFDVTVRDLMAANNITDSRKVRVGQTLVVPGFQPVGTGAIPRATPPPATAPPRSTTPLPPVTTGPVDLPAPEPVRPAELDTLPIESGIEAPPVVPIDEPTPAP